MQFVCLIDTNQIYTHTHSHDTTQICHSTPLRRLSRANLIILAYQFLCVVNSRSPAFNIQSIQSLPTFAMLFIRRPQTQNIIGQRWERERETDRQTAEEGEDKCLSTENDQSIGLSREWWRGRRESERRKMPLYIKDNHVRRMRGREESITLNISSRAIFDCCCNSNLPDRNREEKKKEGKKREEIVPSLHWAETDRFNGHRYKGGEKKRMREREREREIQRRAKSWIDR